MSSIKLKHASGNSMSIAAPATNPSGALELKLPATVGTSNQYLKNSSTAGTLEFGSLTGTHGATDFTISDGNLVVAAGHGIDFSAQTPGSGTGITSGDETLDHYEEGTWTPTIFGGSSAGTYTYEAVRTGGKYTRIGNLVFIEGVLRISAITSAGSGALHFGGLPFTFGSVPTSAWNFGDGIQISHYGAGTNSTQTNYPTPHKGIGQTGESTIEITSHGKNYKVSTDIGDLSAANWIYQISGCYQV